MAPADPNPQTPQLRGSVREFAPWLQPQYTQPAHRRNLKAQEIHSGDIHEVEDPARG